jgi:CRP-like cAMP-binding protein
MKEDVLQLLNAFQRMESALQQHISDLLQPEQIPTGTEVLGFGKPCRKIFFVSSGMFIGQKWIRGKEVTTWIMREGDVVTSPASFLRQIESAEWIITVEDCEVWGITYEQLQETYRRFPAFNLHGRMLTEQYYLKALDREDFMKCNTAKKKYKMLMDTDPELILRCPAKYLASYLNVNKTTFSTIKKGFKWGKK